MSLGEYRRATSEVDDLSRGKKIPGFAYYDFACIYALAAAAAQKDAKLLPAEREQWGEHHAVRAVELLVQAQAAGFFKDPRQIEHLKQDSDLDSLRTCADYQKLLSELEKTAQPRSLYFLLGNLS